MSTEKREATEVEMTTFVGNEKNEICTEVTDSSTNSNKPSLFSKGKDIWKKSAKYRLYLFILIHLYDLITDIILGSQFIIGYSSTTDICKETIRSKTLIGGIMLIIVSTFGFALGMYDSYINYLKRDKQGVPGFCCKLIAILIEDFLSIVIVITTGAGLGVISIAYYQAVYSSVISLFLSVFLLISNCFRGFCCVGFITDNEKGEELAINKNPGSICYILCFNTLFIAGICFLVYNALIDLDVGFTPILKHNQDCHWFEIYDERYYWSTRKLWCSGSTSSTETIDCNWNSGYWPGNLPQNSILSVGDCTRFEDRFTNDTICYDRVSV